MRSKLHQSVFGFPSALLLLGLLGILASSFVSFQLWRAEQARLMSAFNARLSDLAVDLDTGMLGERQVTADLAITQGSLESLDRAQFHIYAEAVFAQHPEMLAVGWAPVVAAADRDRFEQAVRQEGLPDFKIFDLDARRNVVPPADWPVLYPVASNETARSGLASLGFNIGSDPTGFAGLVAAKASGEVIASGPVPLIAPDGTHPPGVVLTKFVTLRNRPAWQTADGPGTGYVSAILKIQPGIQAILDRRNTDELILQVTDVSDSRNPAGLPLYQTEGKSSTAAPSWSTDLSVGSRVWRLSAWPADTSVLQPDSWEPFAALAVGVIVTLLLVRHAHGQGQMAQTIRRKEEYYRSLIEHISDVILVVDRGGRITYNNPATSRVLGYTSDELEQLLPKDLLSSDDLSRIEATGEAAFSSGTGTESSLIRMRHRDGRWVPLETIVTDHLDTPAIEGVVINMRDVTERQRVEIELRQAQKLESVGRLASGIAHEINTPIQFVSDNLHFLLEAAATMFSALRAREEGQVSQPSEDLSMLEEEVPLAIQESLKGVQRVASIVGALKEFAHPDSSQQINADVNHALSTSLTMVRNELRVVANVQTDFGDLPPIRCYLGELNQVFLNLFVNAAHAVADANRGTEGLVEISSQRDGDSVVVRVRDNGCGIADNIQTRIFDPFFTTKGVGRGSGQGLATARSMVVDKHGGSITFTSNVGEGSTFVVRLPIAGAIAVDLQEAA